MKSVAQLFPHWASQDERILEKARTSSLCGPVLFSQREPNENDTNYSQKCWWFCTETKTMFIWGRDGKKWTKY